MLNEVKLVGRRKKFDPWNQALSDLSLSILGKGLTTRLAAKNAYQKGRVTSIVFELNNELLVLLTKFENGELKTNQVLFWMKEALRRAHESAYLKGMKAGGYPKDTLDEANKKWLNASRRDEHKYLTKFINNVLDNKGRMNYEERMEMYADAVKSSYESGRLAALPNNMLVYWRLERSKSPTTGKSVEHCKTCLALNKMNPFTPVNLPTVPKAATNCLTNCLCTLVYVKSTPRKVLQRLNTLGTSEKIIRKLKKEGAGNNM